MHEKKNDDSGADRARFQQFAEDALEWAGRELSALPVQATQDLDTTKRELAEAAMEIGRAVINEMDGLLDEETVLASRRNIIDGLADIIRNGHEHGPHLGEDAVNAVARALGEIDCEHVAID